MWRQYDSDSKDDIKEIITLCEEGQWKMDCGIKLIEASSPRQQAVKLSKQIGYFECEILGVKMQKM